MSILALEEMLLIYRLFRPLHPLRIPQAVRYGHSEQALAAYRLQAQAPSGPGRNVALPPTALPFAMPTPEAPEGFLNAPLTVSAVDVMIKHSEDLWKFHATTLEELLRSHHAEVPPYILENLLSLHNDLTRLKQQQLANEEQRRCRIFQQLSSLFPSRPPDPQA